MIDHVLKARLRRMIRRQRWLGLGWKLALCWALAAVAGDGGVHLGVVTAAVEHVALHRTGVGIVGVEAERHLAGTGVT